MTPLGALTAIGLGIGAAALLGLLVGVVVLIVTERRGG